MSSTNVAETRRTIIRWLIENMCWSELLVLRGCDRDWCDKVSAAFREELTGAVVPKRAFIKIDTCMCCGLGNNAANIRTVYTETDCVLMFCSEPVCRITAIVHLTDPDMSKRLQVSELPKQHVQVLRSSGDIDTDWTMKGLRWSSSHKCLCIRVTKQAWVKDLKLENFATLNPKVKEWAPIRVGLSLFHDRDWVENVKKQFEQAAIPAKHFYSPIIRFVDA